MCGKETASFFPDEQRKPYPRLIITHDMTSLSIEHGVLGRTRFPDGMTAHSELVPTQHHLTFKMPYMGKNVGRKAKAMGSK